jgi:sugar transferase (PEP-CTERM/EpsH1 system associated)
VRILFLTHRLPYAPNRGDRIRALHILKRLARSAEVDLVSLVHDREEEQHAADLEPVTSSITVARVPRWSNYGRAVRALAAGQPLTHALLDAPGLASALRRLVVERPPHVVLAYCSGMARFALEPPLSGLPLVLDMVDVDSVKWRTLAQKAALPLRRVYAAEARSLSAFEARAARHARAVLVVNERERDSLRQIEPAANVQVVPNGVALDAFRPHQPASDERRVVFCGVMGYRPNEDGAVWLARSVWPLVRQEYPDARLSLVGSNPTAAVRRLAVYDPTIEVTGAVPDVRPYLWRSAVAVAPLFVARGLQNKVLEAVAAGLPCVVTPAVLEGLPKEVLSGCLLASDADAFAVAVRRVLARTATERRSIAGNGDMSALTWDSQLARLEPILRAAVLGREPAPEGRAPSAEAAR